MLRITLSPEQREVLGALRRDPRLRPLERDRVEMLFLAASGWSPPAIAQHLGCHPATVRRTFERFWAHGPDGLRQRRTGPPPDQARRAQVAAALTALLEQERTWTAAQLADALGQQGIALSTRQVRRHLAPLRARWRRTARSLRHQQDPARVAAARVELEQFKKRPAPAS